MDVLQLLKICNKNITQIAQVLAHTITTGLIQCTLTWNCIIRAYAHSPKPINALVLYNHFIRTIHFPPDYHTFPALLKACSRLSSLPKGKEIHAHLVKISLCSDIYIQNSFIHFYGEMDKLNDARQIFDEMLIRDLVSYNSILEAYTKDQKHQEEAIIILNEMMRNGIEVDGITLVIVLSCCAQSGWINCAKVIQGFILKKGVRHGLSLENAMLSVYSKVGEMDNASQMFKEMNQRDVVSYTILINNYIKSYSIACARKIFDGIIIKDVILWNSMIYGYVKSGHPTGALELFEKMNRERITPDENTIVPLLSACACLSNLELGRSVHRLVNKMSIKVDTFVGTALIDMYAKCGSLEEALNVFHIMEEKDVYSWTVMIASLANYGYGKEALHMFSVMQKENIKPSDATFVAVLTACSRSGLVNEGLCLFHLMVETYRINPKIQHHGCLIDLLGKAGLLDLAEECNRITPCENSVIAYKALLSACVRYAQANLGEKVAKGLLKLDTQNHGIYVLLSNLYATDGRWDCVSEIRKKMKAIEIRKEMGVSSIHENF